MVIKHGLWELFHLIKKKKVESHPVVQECFILNGEIEGNCGTMVKGSYFWRPRDILHGPYGTKLDVLY